MRFVRWVTVGTLLVGGTGCAYQQAMRQGERAESAGDWPGALEHYTDAKEIKPKSEAAADAIEKARQQAVADAITATQVAIDLGKYEEALEHLKFVAAHDADNPEEYQLRSDAQAAMKSEMDAKWEYGDARGAYGIAVRTRELFPAAEHLDASFDTLRAHFTDKAMSLQDEGEFEQAIEAARTIAEFEPERTANVGAIEHGILAAWADDLGSRARTESRSGHKGAAAVLYARAYEVSGRPEDLEQARAMASTLRGKAFTVQLKVTGDKARTGAMSETLKQRVAALPDASEGGSRSSLIASVTMRTSRCKESHEATPQTKDYVSGQIEVSNPAHEDLQARLVRARDTEKRATADAERLWPDVQRSEEAIKQFEASLAGAVTERDAAQRELEMATVQLDAATKKRNDLEAQLVGLQGYEGTGAAQAAVQDELGKTGARINEWTNAVMAAQAQVEDAERRMSAIEVERVPAAEADARLREAYEAVMQEKTDSQKTAMELGSQLGGTPATVMQDVTDTLEYDVKAWTRTCSAPVSVTMYPRWDTDVETKKAYTPNKEVNDSSNIGHALAGVEEDPKEYASTDAELVASADSETAADLSEWMGKLVDDYYAVRSLETTAAMAKDPIAATTDLLTLYLGAPGHIDEATQLTFGAHVRQHFGLEKLELLRGEGQTAKK